MTTQQIIDVGPIPNDGQGDPLRTAFQITNDNFSNIWAAGPVNSQVVISNNVISTNQTNLELILQGNGIGTVTLDSTTVPGLDSAYDLGSLTQRWDEIHGRYFYGNGRFITGVPGGPTVTFAEIPPNNPNIGDIWIQSNTAVQYLYFSDDTASQWAEMEAYQTFGGGSGSGNVDLTYVQSDIIPSNSDSYNLGNVNDQWQNLWVSNNITLNSVVLTGQGTNLKVNDNTVVLTNGSPTFTAVSVTGNTVTNALYTNNYFYANGAPFPQGSNSVPGTTISLKDNVISTTVINQNLVLKANGIGTLQTDTSIVPSVDNVYDLGSSAKNFDTVYTSYIVGNGATFTSNIAVTGNIFGSYIFGNGYFLTGVGNAVSGNADLTNVQSNILPASNVYSIGNASNQWQSLWVKDTITLNSTPLTVVGNTLQVNGGSVLINGGSPTLAAVSVTGNTVTNALYTDNYFYANGAPFPQGSNSVPGTTISLKDNVISTTSTNQNLVLKGNGIGNIQANSSIMPSVDEAYDLGSPTYRFDTVYAGYFVGNGALLTGISGGNASKIVNGTSYANIATADGNLVVNVGNDGYGTWTFETGTGNLIGPGNISQGAGIVFSADQSVYIREDMGQLNIDAGSHTVITSNSGNVGNTQSWDFGSDGTLTLPASSGQIGRSGYTNGIDLYNSTGSTGYVKMNYADESAVWADVGGSHIQTTGGTWDFGTDGTTQFPGNVIQALEGSPITVKATNGNAYTRFEAGADYAQIGLQDDTTGAYQAWTYLETDMANVNTPSATVILKPGDTGAEVRWTFDAVGNLTLPGNTFAVNYANGDPVIISGSTANTGNVTFSDQIVIGTGISNLVSGLYLAPSTSSAAALQYLRVRGDVSYEPTHIHFDTGNNQYFNQFVGDDNKYVLLSNTGNIVINTSDYGSNTAQWTFDTFGNLTAPGNILMSNIGGIYSSSAGYVVGLRMSNTEPSVKLVANNHEWRFDSNGVLKFPTAPSRAYPAITVGAGELLIQGYEGTGFAEDGGDILIFGGPSGDGNNGNATVFGQQVTIQTQLTSASPSPTNNWNFGANGNLALASTNIGTGGVGSGEAASLRGTRKIVNGYQSSYAYSTVLAAGGTPTVAYTATNSDVLSAKITFAVEGSGYNFWEQFDVSAIKNLDNPGNVNFTVSNRVKSTTAIADTGVTATIDGNGCIAISLNLDPLQGAGWSSFDAVEFVLMVG